MKHHHHVWQNTFWWSRQVGSFFCSRRCETDVTLFMMTLTLQSAFDCLKFFCSKRSSEGMKDVGFWGLKLRVSGAGSDQRTREMLTVNVLLVTANWVTTIAQKFECFYNCTMITKARLKNQWKNCQFSCLNSATVYHPCSK